MERRGLWVEGLPWPGAAPAGSVTPPAPPNRQRPPAPPCAPGGIATMAFATVSLCWDSGRARGRSERVQRRTGRSHHALRSGRGGEETPFCRWRLGGQSRGWAPHGLAAAPLTVLSGCRTSPQLLWLTFQGPSPVQNQREMLGPLAGDQGSFWNFPGPPGHRWSLPAMDGVRLRRVNHQPRAWAWSAPNTAGLCGPRGGNYSEPSC